MSRGRFKLVLGLAVFIACLALPSAALADFGFQAAEVSLRGADGGPLLQAGAHSDVTVRFHVNETLAADGATITSDLNLKDVEASLPPGFVGDPTSIEACRWSELLSETIFGCPVAAQVGFARIVSNEAQSFEVPIYNMQRDFETPATFAFNYAGVVIKLNPGVRAGDYGLTTSSYSSGEGAPVIEGVISLWGIPADPSHDALRQGFLHPGDKSTVIYGGPSPAPRVPFLSNPTSCTGSPLPFSLRANSWQRPDLYAEAPLVPPAGDPAPVMTGCDRVPFEPRISVSATSRRAGAPTGLDFELVNPQSESPDAPRTADVRRTVVTLPPGMTISAAAAAGQGACSVAEIGIGTNAAPTCPASSRLGTVRIATPLLEEELEGEVLLARQKENPFGSLLALYLAVKGPGFYLKLPGEIQADPTTGQVTTTFTDTPQLPFERLRLELRGGPNAPLVSPATCGTYGVNAQVTSWASATPVPLGSSVRFDEGCASGGFSPRLEAGSLDPLAGASTPFTLQVTREDGEANLSAIEARLPEGELAKLAGVPLCPDSAAASGACPAGSQVGKVVAGVGAGPNPLYLPEAGKAPTAVYLAGPYKGAPYSLVVAVPAQAGPFDLGTVAVRSAIQVDPTTTAVTVHSDPLPQILQGIPVSYRDVRVQIDRPDFTRNPTNCGDHVVGSTLTAVTGATASPSVPFGVASCGRLAFRPKLALSLRGSKGRGGNPALTAILTDPAGGANLAGASVLLPRSEFIDQSHVSNPCTRVQFGEGRCPAASILGTAVAYSPLLDRPLEGPVYFRSNGGERQLPDLVVDLGGQIHVTLVGFVDSVKVGKEGSRVRTRFQSIPDAAVSRFVLKLTGGKRGLIENSTDLCKGPQRATMNLTGQNGKVSDRQVRIATPGCGGKAKGKKKS